MMSISSRKDSRFLIYQCDIPGGIHSQFHDIFSAINEPTTSYELAIANRLYGEKTFQFLQQYLSCIQKLYQAELKPADFLNAAEETREQINLWVETFTNGKIKDLFAPGNLSTDTVLVLVNAVYFKGQWAVEFKEENTKERPFQINKTTSIPVQMMYRKGEYKIATIEEHDCQVLELPYKDGDLSMYILLPKDYTGLTQLEKELTYEKLTTWNSPDHLKEDEVEVSLPQFKMETSAQLNQYLEALGMTDVFRREVSDLSGMAKEGGLFTKTKPVQMMFVKDTFPICYLETMKSKIAELPYVNNDRSMLILLPDDTEDKSTGLTMTPRKLQH
ncbi:Serpin B4 [Platysternon megacephalum]|uniref:Serpin B4 n=1 Tax=Platysternon megacephalum TaxID=55544 RepID=A0A4D9F2L9_9SAUR|nr:Serpin B4 [Platysternon megacephalum]